MLTPKLRSSTPSEGWSGSSRTWGRQRRPQKAYMHCRLKEQMTDAIELGPCPSGKHLGPHRNRCDVSSPPVPLFPIPYPNLGREPSSILILKKKKLILKWRSFAANYTNSYAANAARTRLVAKVPSTRPTSAARSSPAVKAGRPLLRGTSSRGACGERPLRCQEEKSPPRWQQGGKAPAKSLVPDWLNEDDLYGWPWEHVLHWWYGRLAAMFPTVQGGNLDWPVVDYDDGKEKEAENEGEELDDIF